MSNYLTNKKIWEEINKDVYNQILTIAILEDENETNILNNLLEEGMESYWDRNLINRVRKRKNIGGKYDFTSDLQDTIST